VGNVSVDGIVTGKTPQGAWYNDKYVDGYGKGNFELVKSYCVVPKRLDREFARTAASIFRKKFPHAEEDPYLFMREILILANDKGIGTEGFRMRLRRLAPIYGIHSEYPLESEKSLKRFSTSSDLTTIFMLRPDELKALEAYGLDRTLLEELAGRARSESPLLLRKKTPLRWLIFCIAPDFEGQEKALHGVFPKR